MSTHDPMLLMNGYSKWTFQELIFEKKTPMKSMFSSVFSIRLCTHDSMLLEGRFQTSSMATICFCYTLEVNDCVLLVFTNLFSNTLKLLSGVHF